MSAIISLRWTEWTTALYDPVGCLFTRAGFSPVVLKFYNGQRSRKICRSIGEAVRNFFSRGLGWRRLGSGARDNDRDMRELVIRIVPGPVPGTTTITGPVDIWSQPVPGPLCLLSLNIDYSLFIQTFLLFGARSSFFFLSVLTLLSKLREFLRRTEGFFRFSIASFHSKTLCLMTRFYPRFVVHVFVPIEQQQTLENAQVLALRFGNGKKETFFRFRSTVS